MAEPREMTKSDLDRLVEDTVSRYAQNSRAEFEKSIDALRTEVLGPERGEQVAETRDKARSDFAQLTTVEQNRAFREARASLFNGEARSFHVDGSGLPDDLRKMGWGKGGLFQRAVLLMLRARKEGQGWAWCESEARNAGHVDLADVIEQRVLQAGDLAGAGALIPEVFSTDFIAALYARSIVRLAGARVMDISERGSMTLGRQNATATAHWIGENESIPASQGDYGQLKLDAKRLGVFVPVSNDAIRYATGSFDQLVAEDMVNIAALKEDLAFLRGSGTSGQPKGLIKWANSNNAISADAAGADDFVKQTTDLLKLQFKVENSDVPTVSPAWLMSTREKYGLMLTKTSGGEGYAFKDEMVMNGTLMAAPYYATSQLPTNLDNSGDGNDDESEFIYAEMSQVVIGDAITTEIDANPFGSYTDSGSTRRDAFQSDETVLRLIHGADIALRHNEAVAYAENASYGKSLE